MIERRGFLATIAGLVTGAFLPASPPVSPPLCIAEHAAAPSILDLIRQRQAEMWEGMFKYEEARLWSLPEGYGTEHLYVTADSLEDSGGVINPDATYLYDDDDEDEDW